MGLTIYHDSDAGLDALEGAKVAIIGYGNQGRAHALNLRDSGVAVLIGQRAGASAEQAKRDGFRPEPVRDAAAAADLIILTLPDESAADTYDREVAPVIRAGCTLGFVHGFNIHFGFIAPAEDVDVIMVAPKGPGTLLRSSYVDGLGVPSLLAIHNDCSGNAKRTALAWAKGIGATRAAVVVETTFACETETDLFGEQVVLCGGVSALTKAAFDTLVEAGYEPEFAYLECVHELKQVVDLLFERGLSGMRDAISNTAEYGDLTRGPRVIGDAVRQEMRQILGEIRSGAFAKEWMNEHRRGKETFRALHESDVDTPYERAGRAVRGLMPWLARR